MNLNEAALKLTFDEYRRFWYAQLGETPPEPTERLTVAQHRDERLIRDGYRHRRERAANCKHRKGGGEG